MMTEYEPHTRREFIDSVIKIGALGAAVLMADKVPAAANARQKFKLKYAPHFDQFAAHAGEDVIDQLKFMADEGFTALEDNEFMRRPVQVQEKIASTLVQLNMAMGVFVVQVGGNDNKLFVTGERDNPKMFAKACKAAVEAAQRVNATWATVVPGNFKRELPMGIQTANVIDVLRAGVEVFEKHRKVMVLEPLADTPDLFLRTADQAYAICRGVNSPACKILFDMYHLQQNQGSIIASIEQVWEEIAYFQVGDVPGRNWPGTGEMNYRNIFAHIRARMQSSGRDFVLGMEHGPWGKSSKTDERACIDAYRAIDSTL